MCYKWSEMPVVVSGNTDLKKKLGRHVFEGCLVSSCLRPTQQTRDPAADSRAYLRPQKRFQRAPAPLYGSRRALHRAEYSTKTAKRGRRLATKAACALLLWRRRGTAQGGSWCCWMCPADPGQPEHGRRLGWWCIWCVYGPPMPVDVSGRCRAAETWSEARLVADSVCVQPSKGPQPCRMILFTAASSCVQAGQHSAHPAGRTTTTRPAASLYCLAATIVAPRMLRRMLHYLQ